MVTLIDIFQITGLVLNTSHFICANCTTPHYIFGSPKSFRNTASQVGASILGELPLVGGVSEASDRGAPYMLSRDGNPEWRNTMKGVAETVWTVLHQ